MNRLIIRVSDSGALPSEVEKALDDTLLIHGVFEDETRKTCMEMIANALLTSNAGKGKHFYAKHDEGCPEGSREDILGPRNCMVCDGGLGICVICGGAEASLTTECPGYKIGHDTLDKVMASKIDFRNGWVGCEPVWFGNHVEACVVSSHSGTSRPEKPGFEITHCPGLLPSHGCDWVATPLKDGLGQISSGNPADTGQPFQGVAGARSPAGQGPCRFEDM